MLGKPDTVYAVGGTGSTGVDVNVAAVTGHPNGAVGVVQTGLEAFSGWTAEIVGTDGVVTIEPPFHAPNAAVVNRHDGAPERVELPNIGLAHEAAHAQERILAGERESDVVPLSASVELMGVLDECRRQLGVRYPGEP